MKAEGGMARRTKSNKAGKQVETLVHDEATRRNIPRTREQLDGARAAVRGAGQEVFELSERGDDPVDQVSIGPMHLAKGLEFKAVAVMACDDEVLPLQSRIESVADEVDLDDVYETERQRLYVACTRARDRLLVRGVQPGSEFLNGLK